jgi:hypothetical protein
MGDRFDSIPVPFAASRAPALFSLTNDGRGKPALGKAPLRQCDPQPKKLVCARINLVRAIYFVAALHFLKGINAASFVLADNL